jgi:hypothetical protein
MNTQRPAARQPIDRVCFGACHCDGVSIIFFGRAIQPIRGEPCVARFPHSTRY